MIMTSPIMMRHIRHAITISAKEFVGFINSSSFQLFEEDSGANTMS
jgi:hypothetical protein